MWSCISCHYAIEMDDTKLVRLGTRQCVCLRCFERIVDDMRYLPRTLLREIIALMNEVK